MDLISLKCGVVVEWWCVVRICDCDRESWRGKTNGNHYPNMYCQSRARVCGVGDIISALQEPREVTLMYGLLNERVPGLEKMNITKGEVISAQAKVNSATYHQRPNHHARTTMTSDFMLFSTQLSIMM